jgi:DNA damage-binding protein 1
VIRPDLLFATTDGRLGIVGELTAGSTRTFDDLQRNMDKYHKGPGGIGWKTWVDSLVRGTDDRWRRGGTELVKRDTAGFIDGDLSVDKSFF